MKFPSKFLNKNLATFMIAVIIGMVLYIQFDKPTNREALIHTAQAEAAQAERDLTKITDDAEYWISLANEKLQEAQEIMDSLEELTAQAESKANELNAIRDFLQLLKKNFLFELNKDESKFNFQPTEEPGIEAFLQKNAAGFVKEKADLFRASGLLNKVSPELLVCIAQADSSLGNALKSNNNIGNVGNNDRGDTVSYSTLEEAVNRIGLVLNNRYMGGIEKVGHLSQGGRNVIGSQYSCGDAPAPYKCYATSPYNWNNNVVGCMNEILKVNIDENFKFRTN
jgi:hypothetical protein